VHTTTLEIARPADFAPLERWFHVERYVLLDAVRSSTMTALARERHSMLPLTYQPVWYWLSAYAPATFALSKKTQPRQR
jgi:hypothetical protein